MKKHMMIGMMALTVLAGNARAAETLEVTVGGINKKGVLGDDYAFCVPPEGKNGSEPGKNISPAIHWSKGPKDTKSYAIIMVDTEVPTDFTNAGKEGTAIAADMPRQPFYHWALADVSPDVQGFKEGEVSDDTKAAPSGVPGLNDYPKFMKLELNEKNITAHSNYDGPCPPWNDEKMHLYHFQVYALDVESLKGLKKNFSGADLKKAIEGHIIAQGEVQAKYTNNHQMRQ